MLRRNVSKFSHKINVRRQEVNNTRIFGIWRYSLFQTTLCVCVWITTDTGLAFVPYVLFSLVYPYLTYVCYLVSRQERKGERIYSSNAMCNIIYACVTSHVQNHACSESLSNIHVVDLRLWKYLFYVNNFTYGLC